MNDDLPPLPRWGLPALPAMMLLGASCLPGTSASRLVDRTGASMFQRRAIFGIACAIHLGEAFASIRYRTDTPGQQARLFLRTLAFGGPSLVAMVDNEPD